MSKQRLSVLTAAAAIKGQLRKNEKFSQGVRLHAVYQVARGRPAEEVAELYDSCHKAVCNWVHRYNAEGVEGLKDRPRRGRPSRISAAQLEELRQAVLESPERHGFRAGVWTGAMATAYVKAHFGIAYKPAQIYNLLARLGLSFQRGRAAYPEAHAEARKARVAEIKKKLGRCLPTA